MRFEFRTLKRAISTLVVLSVLFLGMSFDVSAKDKGRRWGRGNDRGRHLGWTRGRRVGHHRRDDDNDRSRWRRLVRRDRRDDRRSWRRHRRSDRRSNWDNDRNWQRDRFRQSSRNRN
ncbi:MAG: hypothetical protein ABW208_09405 [Pyrinomonadaceae bacterium]